MLLEDDIRNVMDINAVEFRLYFRYEASIDAFFSHGVVQRF